MTFKLVPPWGVNMLSSVPARSNPICASKIVEKISVNTWATAITAVFCVLHCWTGKGSEWLHWTLNLKKIIPEKAGMLSWQTLWDPKLSSCVLYITNGQTSSSSKSNSGRLNPEYPSSLKGTWKLVISRRLFGAFSPFQGNVLELPSRKHWLSFLWLLGMWISVKIWHLCYTCGIRLITSAHLTFQTASLYIKTDALWC